MVKVQDLGKGYVELIDQLNKGMGIDPLGKTSRRKNVKKKNKR